jgi:hypothetical protein
MKKLLFTTISVLLLLSCSSDDNSSNSGVYKWKFKLDGVLYEWSGPLGSISGGSTYSSSGRLLGLSKDENNIMMSVSVILPSNSIGNYTLSNSQSFMIGIFSSNEPTFYSILNGGVMEVNITSFSNNSFLSNPSNPGIIKGTFSGTIRKDGEGLSNITEGSFEAIRAD